MIIEAKLGARDGSTPDPDEALCTRLRDLSLVDLDALTIGLDGARGQALAAAYADDCADALDEVRARLTALRKQLAGPDPLNVLDITARQRASDAGHAGAVRIHDRLVGQAEAARTFARLADLAAGLAAKLFQADRRR
ncbi:MAG TPA: hypothetical protein VIV40_15540 [Kofleriaceae bacterium]